MSADESADEKRDDAANKGITEIAVQGFKSLYDEQRITVRPLTILAGANNSGKSSIMQPLLMMKQTLDATYDPGPLKLDGPNVHFTSAEQFLSRRLSDLRSPHDLDKAKLTVGLGIRGGASLTITFQYQRGKGIDIFETIDSSSGKDIPLRPGIEIVGDDIDESTRQTLEMFARRLGVDGEVTRIEPFRERCFLGYAAYFGETRFGDHRSFGSFEEYIRELVHVPALRGNPRRTYETTSFGPESGLQVPGTFEHYVAGIVNYWQDTQNCRLEKLGRALKKLGLTWKVEARRLNDVEIELRAARLSKRQVNEREDLVNIADMGVGVSQVLPVLVALLTAVPGQLVYLEHPERDLHPRAQVALAKLLADAAQRGVRVVVETHSSLLLLGVQTLVAEGKLPPDHVALHWFERGDDGATTVTSADLDDAGAFGDWPEDFGDVELKSESRYLDAAESVLWKQARAS